jgi:hypothetical protein
LKDTDSLAAECEVPIICSGTYILYIYNRRKNRLIWTVERIWQSELLKNLTQLAINGGLEEALAGVQILLDKEFKKKIYFLWYFWVKIPLP